VIKASGKWRDNMLASLTETNIKKYGFLLCRTLAVTSKAIKKYLTVHALISC